MKAALRNPLLWVACAILLCVVVIAVTQVISCSARWQHKQEIKQSENEFSRKAKIEAARSQIGAFGSAIDLYRLTLDQYPPSLDALRVAPADLPDPTKWDGPYLAKEIPPDPWGGNISTSPQADAIPTPMTSGRPGRMAWITQRMILLERSADATPHVQSPMSVARPTLRVGGGSCRPSASVAATRSVADGAFPRRTVGTRTNGPRVRASTHPTPHSPLAAQTEDLAVGRG